MTQLTDYLARMKPTPIIKDTCLLCGDGMTDDCNLCWREEGRVYLRPEKRWGFNWRLIVSVVLIALWIAGGIYILTRVGQIQSPPAPTPAPALSTQALYESQIRDLTHEIHAREVQLDTLVRALETTAAERDAALNLLSQIQRGQEL